MGPSLESIRIFLAVVEAMSFSAAARRLSLSQSKVSKCITRLEEDLGAKLVVRSTRRLTITEAGESFYRHGLRVVAEMDEAVMAVQRRSDSVAGHLRVFSTLGVGQRLLLPAIAEFMTLHPAISVELSLTGQLINPIEHHFDLGVRMTNESDPVRAQTALDYREIARFHLVPCAAPSYLAKHGRPQHPRDLTRHNCLIHSSKTVSGSWGFTSEDGEYVVPVSGTFASNSGSAVHEAALAGLGVAYILDHTVADDIAAGRLVQIFPTSLCSVRALTAIYPRAVRQPRRLDLFLDFLADYFEKRLPESVSARAAT